MRRRQVLFTKETRRAVKNQRKMEAQSGIDLRMWTHRRAVKALPYIRAIARSLRGSWLDLQRARLQVRRLNAQSGSQDRSASILRAEAVREAGRAEDDFNQALRELETIHVQCLDPGKGLALIPFSKDDDLAWFIFDLFAPHGLIGWRFEVDPVDTRRILADLPPQGWADGVFSSKPLFPAFWKRQRTNPK